MTDKSRKSNQMCCVVGCSNTYKNNDEVQLFRFPNKPWEQERKYKWVQAVNRKNPDGSNWEPLNSSRICSRHFVGNNKSLHPNSPSYIPSIFPPVYKRKELDPSSESRFERAAKRHVSFGKSMPSSSGQEILPTNEMEETSLDLPDPIPNTNQPCSCSCSKKATFQDASTQTDIMAVPQPELDKEVPFSKPKTADKQIDAVPFNLTSNTSFLVCKGFHGFPSIGDDTEMLDLAGVSRNTFNLLLKILPDGNERKVKKEDRLLIFLIKLKTGLTYSALRVLFSIHRTTVAVIFKTVLCQLAQLTARFTHWPSREAVYATMPDVFKEHYKNCRVIIDCTEVKVQQPKEVDHRIFMYSNYKSTFTHKVLLGITPNGSISFVSKTYGGRSSDSFMTIDSDFINLLEPGDEVLADKGFPGIKSCLQPKHVVIVMPPMLHNGRFSEEEVNETYKVASVRIHVERAIQRIKIYNILGKVPYELFPFIDKIMHMCCVLANLQPHIIKLHA